MRQEQLGIGAGHAVHRHHIDVQGARAPTHVADPPGRLLQRLTTTQPAPFIRISVVDDEHGVQEVVLLDATPRRGLVDRGCGDENVRETGDGSAQVGQAVAEVRAE
jgi:hypothetical protein